MYGCVERGKRRVAEELARRACGMCELESSHGGGNDYSAPCVLHINVETGRHKGKHRTASGHTWTPNEHDRKFGVTIDDTLATIEANLAEFGMGKPEILN